MGDRVGRGLNDGWIDWLDVGEIQLVWLVMVGVVV